VAVIRGEAGEELLDRYDRQRRTIAVKHTQAQTIRNKRLLTEKDPAIRQKNQEELRRTAGDPELARQFLLRAALFNSVREAAEIA
jgi:3-(3-hydroxy-phenyl)propionate hydroxylase